MARIARKISEFGLYHVMFRGMARQNIFEEAADYEKLKEIIIKVKKETGMELYAYCFMTNHVHMFIKEKELGDISIIMKKILSHYATWFNKKYQRAGALFAGRYKSEPVEDEGYYMGLVRYIHQNPMKAKMVNKISDYPYSSYHDYLAGEDDFVDIDLLLKMLHDNKDKAIIQFVELNEVKDEDAYEISNSFRKSHGYIRRIIMSEIDGQVPEKIKSMDKLQRDTLVRKLVNEKGVSKSALERATGISRGTIIRICKQIEQKVTRPQTVQHRKVARNAEMAPKTVSRTNLPTELL